MVCLMLIFGVPTVLLPFVYGPVIDEFAKHCFGPTQLGKLIGILTAVASVGYAAGPVAVGWIYDQSGTYRYAFVLLLGLTIVAAALLSWVQPTYRNQLVRRGIENVPISARSTTLTRGRVKAAARRHRLRTPAARQSP